jgi:hypothetical protein
MDMVEQSMMVRARFSIVVVGSLVLNGCELSLSKSNVFQ